MFCSLIRINIIYTFVNLALSNDTLNEILNEPAAAREVLSYHMIPGRLLTSTIIDGQQLSPLLNLGSPLRFKLQKKVSS